MADYDRHVLCKSEIADMNLSNVEEMIVDTPLPSDKDDDFTNSAMQTKDSVQLDSLLEGINLEKLEQRAERFHSELTPVKTLSESELKSLYKSLDVNWRSITGMRAGKVRLDAVHVRGVSNMSTEDIFEYFKDYAPASVEWVNDQSCNVLWLDAVSPARALVTLSQPIKKVPTAVRKLKHYKGDDDPNHETAVEVIEDVEMIEHDTYTAATKSRHRSSSSVESDSHHSSSVRTTTDQSNTPVPNNSPVDVEHAEDASLSDSSSAEVDASTINIPIPPGAWRLGTPHPKAKFLLVRFAYRSDRKIQGAEKLSQYYLKYGNPNYKGLKGIISTSLKRKLKEGRQRPRGYVDLDAVEDDELYVAESQFNLESKQQKDQSKRPRMRMYADDEEEKTKRAALLIGSNSSLRQGDLRNKIGSEKLPDPATIQYEISDSSDLRSRLRYKSTEGGQDLSRPAVIGDLRSKLEKLRQSRQPKVPLLIEIVQDDV